MPVVAAAAAAAAAATGLRTSPRWGLRHVALHALIALASGRQSQLEGLEKTSCGQLKSPLLLLRAHVYPFIHIRL